MPYNEPSANRLREQMKGRRSITERKMFGGLCFMLFCFAKPRTNLGFASQEYSRQNNSFEVLLREIFNIFRFGEIPPKLEKRRRTKEMLSFLLRRRIKGNMLCGVEKENLVIRVGPEQYPKILKKPHARPMDFTGRPLKGFV